MKKIFFVTLIAIMLFIMPISAANVGDKIGEALYTDIVAYVNNYPMPAYVIDSYAVIVAEDLRDYCCDVTYDNATRSLNITKAGDGATFSNKPVYKPNRETGELFKDVLYTDIKTYVNGNEVKSFNVDGKTMIVIDEFGKYMDGYEWDNVNRAAKAWLVDKPMGTYRSYGKRTEVLFRYSGKSLYNTWYDIDFDGVEDYINVMSTQGYAGEHIKVTIGDKTKTLEAMNFFSTILVTDIDLSDGVKDLVVFTWYDGGELTMKIIKCDRNMTEYKFVQYDISNQLWLGGAGGYSWDEGKMFAVNEDGTFNVVSQEASSGMWDVTATYRETYKGSKTYAEVPVEHYEIQLDEFMNPNRDYAEMGDYEKTMWAQGFIRAYTAYKGEGINLEKDEYFKVLYDNGENYVYIVKTDGQAGWIYIGNYTQREALNRYFFYLAG